MRVLFAARATRCSTLKERSKTTPKEFRSKIQVIYRIPTHCSSGLIVISKEKSSYLFCLTDVLSWHKCCCGDIQSSRCARLSHISLVALTRMYPTLLFSLRNFVWMDFTVCTISKEAPAMCVDFHRCAYVPILLLLQKSICYLISSDCIRNFFEYLFSVG